MHMAGLIQKKKTNNVNKAGVEIPGNYESPRTNQVLTLMRQ